MLPRVPTNLCSCLDKIHATTHAPTAELQLSRDTVSISPCLTLRSVVFEDGHRNTGSVSLTPSSILSSNNNGLAREFFKHLPSSVWFRAMCATIVALCPNVLRCQIYSRVSEMRGVTGSADFAPEPSTFPPSTFPSLPRSTFHLTQPSTFPPSTLPSLPRHPRFSFLPAARCSQQYPDPGKLTWQSLNVRRDKIWRHTKCDDSMGNSMKYDSWQLTDQ